MAIKLKLKVSGYMRSLCLYIYSQLQTSATSYSVQEQALEQIMQKQQMQLVRLTIGQNHI